MGTSQRKDGQIGISCLSQWYEIKFEYEGNTFLTAEHWMMAEKAKLFGDKAVLEKILNCNSPKEAKSLGRKVKNFDEKIWTENSERIVINGNYLKFKQNKELWEYLNGTCDKILVEASPYDKIWGVGMKNGDTGIENPGNWKGLNLLGYALMEVRDKLRNE
ncbi:MAG: NADAR family protein [Saprospiraceae bacterium]